MTSGQIENWFRYQAIQRGDPAACNRLRDAAKDFAITINELFPDSAEKTAAIKRLLEAVMRANASEAYQECGKLSIAPRQH